jgi:c-di-GMP-binding flagellar brake protein YcgR
MGLHTPRGKFERLDVILAAQAVVGGGEVRRVVAGTCRNISAGGCRLQVEDASRLPPLDVNSSLEFSVQLDPAGSPIQGIAKVAWIRRERGDSGKIRVVVGMEFVTLPLSERERIKAYIKARVQP